MGKINLLVLTAVAVISLALLLFGQHLLFNNHTLRNWEARFTDIPGVAAAAVDSTPRGLTLTLKLAGDVEFRETFHQLLDLAVEAGVSPAAIILEDTRGPVLSQAFYDIHYAVEEGLATGRFQLMADTVRRALAVRGIDDYQLWVDQQFVYLEMHYGSEHLYHVFPRWDLKPLGNAV